MSETSIFRLTLWRIFHLIAPLGALVLALFIPASAFAAFGLTTATDYYTVDTGAGLVFKVRRTDNGVSTQSAGDLMSLVYNGFEYQDTSRGSQLNSGFDYLYTGVSAVSVSAAIVNTNYIKVTVTAGDATHYYLARKGDAKIYMATYFTTEPSTLGLCRYIVRIPSAILPNGPTSSDIRNNTGAIESADIFGYADGTTRSKHYSNMRLKDWAYIGATGTNVGVWMVRDNNEGGSGGPFFRCLLNQCGDDQEITYIVNYGEGQTEAFRTSILDAYTLVFTNGAAPGAVDTSWFSGMSLTGYVPASGRNNIGIDAITGRDANCRYTVGFSNSTAQYWTDADAYDGSIKMGKVIIPGTYTMTIYKNELAVYKNTNVLVPATGYTSLGAIAIPDPTLTASTNTGGVFTGTSNGDLSRTVPLWRIGNWDGTPAEFLNGDKVNTMHPSDVRMNDWNPGPYVIGASNPATGMPCYQWKDVNGTQTVQFNLTASQLVASTVRIGITTAYAGGRPNVSVNAWTASALPSASTQPNSRTLTVGTHRGNNYIYTFNVPASALVAGTNTLYISPISGSSGTTFLSPGYSLDCVDMYQGTARNLAVPAAPANLTATPGNAKATLGWTAVTGAASYAVQRASTSGGPYALVASGLTASSYTDSNLTNGATYYYLVNASNTSGAGLSSTQISATPLAPPAVPAGVSATGGNAQVSLNWAASSGASSYTVSRSATSGGNYTAVSNAVTSTVFNDTGLTNGVTYYYVVSAANQGGASGNSAPASATPAQTFAQWQAAAFPGQTNPAVVGPTADPDNDGYSNLLEYFFGTNPASADAAGSISGGRDGAGNLTLTFRMSKNLSAGVTYAVQQSSDLQNWMNANAAGSVVSEQSGYYVMRFTAPATVSDKLFLRLSITAP